MGLLAPDCTGHMSRQRSGLYAPNQDLRCAMCCKLVNSRLIRPTERRLERLQSGNRRTLLLHRFLLTVVTQLHVKKSSVRDSSSIPASTMSTTRASTSALALDAQPRETQCCKIREVEQTQHCKIFRARTYSVPPGYIPPWPRRSFCRCREWRFGRMCTKALMVTRPRDGCRTCRAISLEISSPFKTASRLLPEHCSHCLHYVLQNKPTSAP